MSLTTIEWTRERFTVRYIEHNQIPYSLDDLVKRLGSEALFEIVGILLYGLTKQE